VVVDELGVSLDHYHPRSETMNITLGKALYIWQYRQGFPTSREKCSKTLEFT
jgi:hypothetical protein